MSFEFEVVRDDSIPSDGEPPRQGDFWVRKHSHEIVAKGDESKPNGTGIVRRSYFDDLTEGITSWGKYAGASHKTAKALEYLDLVCESYGAQFHECFYVNDGVPSSYLAVALNTSGHSGRMWLLKTAIHFMRPFPGATKIDGEKNIFSFHFSDFVDKKAPNFGTASRTPVCRFTHMAIPLSLICDCGNPECEFSGDR
jgi:hypothetical protein